MFRGGTAIYNMGKTRGSAQMGRSGKHLALKYLNTFSSNYPETTVGG